jgi:predicted dehydrogenase
MTEPRFVVFGAGFWARYQLAAWGEVGGVTCVAVCDPMPEKAAALAERYGVPTIYADPDEAFRQEKPDFADIVATPDAHAGLIRLAAKHRVPVICQKPLCPTPGESRAVTAECHSAGVPLLVHENWRWQTPLRGLKRVLDSGAIGPVFRGRITYSNSFPVFDAQPFLRLLDRFILTDIGTHILDVARFLFGEAESLFCVTRKVRPDIRGEDVATVLMRMTNGAAVTCEMSYASKVEHDRFPETFVFAEGERGGAELGPDYWVRVTTAAGTQSNRHPPTRYPWCEPGRELVQASMVPCLRNLLGAIKGGAEAETTAADNLKTLGLVFGAYESAERGEVVRPGEPGASATGGTR